MANAVVTFQGKSLSVRAVEDITHGELTQVDGCMCVCVVMGVGGTFQGKSLWVQAVDDIAYGELTQVDGCMCVWGVGVGGSGIPRQVSVGTSSG